MINNKIHLKFILILLICPLAAFAPMSGSSLKLSDVKSKHPTQF